MADVLLINFPFRSKGIPTIMPIHIAALGSYLVERGHSVQVLDLNVNSEQELFELLSSKKFDVVGVGYRNVLPAFWLERFRSLRRFISRLSAFGVEPIVGGPGFSLFAPKIFQLVKELKFGTIGEGENALLKFVGGEKVERIAGICYRAENGVRTNYPPLFLKGEEIPMYRDLVGLNYAHPSYLVGLQTYRGCNFSCAYCPVKFLRGENLRLRPLEHVRMDLEFLKAKGVKHIFIIDGVFNFPKERSQKILDMLLELNYPESWEGFLKPLSDVDEDFIKKIAQARGVRFHIDVITGSERLSPLIEHSVDVNEALRTANMLKKFGIEGVFYFAYHLPKEGFKDRVKTIRTLKSVVRMSHKTYLYPFFPYPHTGFEKRYGDILNKKATWHFWRLFRMVFSPSFLRFVKNMRSLKDLSGPKERPLTKERRRSL